MIRISNIKIYEDISDEEIFQRVINKYNISIENIINWNISKKSVDAREKNNIHYSYSLDLEVRNEEKLLKNKNISKIEEVQFPKIKHIMDKLIQPVIVGAGPAGLFSALTFIKNGYKPIIIEQGQCVEDRKKTVNNFINNGILNINSNIQFGEGGAGTFSDGKLTTSINSPYCKTVLKEFVHFGAPNQILSLTKPHIGTDNLINIVKNMRKYIISNGRKILI